MKFQFNRSFSLATPFKWIVRLFLRVDTDKLIHDNKQLKSTLISSQLKTDVLRAAATRVNRQYGTTSQEWHDLRDALENIDR
jgi:hypothetical protein